VVEVRSPDDSVAELDRKAHEYLAAGVRLVWVADPDRKSVRVHRPGTDVHELHADDRLTGDDVLPGFDVAVATLFEE
jgi:Uma2 family endonuclease